MVEPVPFNWNKRLVMVVCNRFAASTLHCAVKMEIANNVKQLQHCPII